jgi:hypothetical protein
LATDHVRFRDNAFMKGSSDTLGHGDYYSGRVEAGSNASTVALRVVRGDEKGSLESETVKYDRESHGTRTRE